MKRNETIILSIRIRNGIASMHSESIDDNDEDPQWAEVTPFEDIGSVGMKNPMVKALEVAVERFRKVKH